jgi:hypothetical protein
LFGSGQTSPPRKTVKFFAGSGKRGRFLQTINLEWRLTMRKYNRKASAVKSRKTHRVVRIPVARRSSPAWKMVERLAEESREGRWSPNPHATAIFLHLTARCETRLERSCLLGLGADVLDYDLDAATEAVEVCFLENALALKNGGVK